MEKVGSLDELAALAVTRAPLYVRFSAGPDADAAEASRDHESGCELPGLSVNPLNPEPWFDRPPVQWVARQLVQYAHLDQDGRFAWVLTGRVAGRGPDCEPLLADVEPVAAVSGAVVREARDLYARAFDAGDDGT
ncbi:hypothetical protein Xcel_3079 [Xylanimonas cellulosilytica DSM 15894]|uniref:Uncharacterized protein n=1 Tax=Xylanimonas cellulosilytica (strain DSM 15894 / JCM 12276 / CECT 5975 / KCTC 9989 / LMG 20990 / NBRC 107835 / XIL07) TaxID=446471 RepID=D1BZV3_XYLCX|nr:DUF6098 family protein [Xylanimonas cellulosilytica]ACZ32081.1 hypothetical protein Xcel_3079 [Xylanimonas cellulosilytica DSM 15894]